MARNYHAVEIGTTTTTNEYFTSFLLNITLLTNTHFGLLSSSAVKMQFEIVKLRKQFSPYIYIDLEIK